ncbi:GNAT family N-acetyltransferase [Aquimarina sp. ERC-38]|uniref:GNAT family N-acetyltransferase n=1 Tax=Aquimarina sp. ERC-38 TaxID=2949996 RepID=UPI0022469C69|nr:GNAT family N-acetyltransferase [Aquimarina sp. ERC-38]UZO80636.1 GNAT family N-acetyltransferase [Aquimarina sp. ERC-38]
MKNKLIIKENYLYSQSFTNFGTIDIRRFRITQDSQVLYQWVNQEYAVFWGMQGFTLPEVQEEYYKLMMPDHYDVFVGFYKEQPAFILERYHPQQDAIGTYFHAKKEDCGIHIIVAPPSIKIPNFTWYVFQAITTFIFQNQEVNRILVEPDIRNKKMFALCQRIGFVLDKVVELPHKTAQLAFLTRNHFEQLQSNPQIKKRSALNTLDHIISPKQSVHHLHRKTWQKANDLLVKKALTEFSHELLLTPTLLSEGEEGWNTYQVFADDKHITYQFSAKLLTMNHFWISEQSIKKTENGENSTLDAVLFIKEFRQQLGIKDEQLPVYLEEIISTLYGSAFKLQKGNPTSDQLVTADFQTIEQSMTEGHPGFVANNGRIGFDSNDYRAYAPEAGNSFSLLWLAGHKEHTKYSGTADLDYQTILKQELDATTITNFNQIIKEKGLNPKDYYFVPVHPWQWFNKLANTFSTEIATEKLICLGYGPDQYVAQQSIRTLFNLTNPKKFYTKTALSILNMGFMRGLPYYYLGTAPKMAVWLEELLYQDPYIQETRFRMLGEIASVSYINPYFEEFGPHNNYNKMLASLWRESPMSVVKPRQQLMTMAAFLHVDQNGNALLPEIIRNSELEAEDWLEQYFKAYLTPMLHCFYQYDLVFMPHGENIIMVLENSVPKQILLKDITEEACILSPEVELPEHLKRMYAPVPEDVKLLSIFTDIFDGFFRFMSHILVEHAGYREELFWEAVAISIQQYQERFPQLQEKFERYDLFAADFQLSCLNRLQLNNHKQMIDLDDPVALLQFAGRLTNPIAAFKTTPISTIA